jgi:divalent metal cation (Fe/Co/Zn/Cd) transporter
MRHPRALFGASLAIAALLVLLWQGSLLVLGLAAFGIGVLLLAGVVLILRLAARRVSDRPDAYR